MTIKTDLLETDIYFAFEFFSESLKNSLKVQINVPGFETSGSDSGVPKEG